MISIKQLAATTGVAATLALGMTAVSATPASAYVVCGNGGECWHTDRHYRYTREVQAQVHPDNWYFHQDWAHDSNHHWRDHHEGRGYYRNGVWIVF